MPRYSTKMVRFWATLLPCFFFWLIMGPIGILFGLFFGRFFTSAWFNLIDTQQRIQNYYFKALFQVLGYMCKADGQISAKEIKAAENLFKQMDLTAHGRKIAIEYFKQGQAGDFDIEKTLAKLKQYCETQKGLLRFFLQIQFEAARIDGMTPEQQKLLNYISTQLGFSSKYYYKQSANQDNTHNRYADDDNPDDMLQNYEGNDYALLEVDSNVSKADLKRAYRKLMSQHHPDKMIAKGLPESMIKMATKKTQAIQKAYERIKLAKGF